MKHNRRNKKMTTFEAVICFVMTVVTFAVMAGIILFILNKLNYF
jgi:cell division protein FtsL